MVSSGNVETRSSANVLGIERLDRGSGIRPDTDGPEQGSFHEMLRNAEREEPSAASRESDDRGALQSRPDGAFEHREKALAEQKWIDQQQRADADARRLEGDKQNHAKETRERTERLQQEDNRDSERQQARESESESLAAASVAGGLAPPLAQAVAELAEDSSGGSEVRTRARDTLWQATSASAASGTSGASGHVSGAVVSESILQFLPAADAAGEPGPMRSGLDLLNFQEMMDPGLEVEAGGEEILEKLQQALKSGGDEMLDELGDIVLPQVVRSIAALARSGTNEMRLQLQPPELGELELSIRTTDGVVRAEIIVSSAEVKQLLESQLERLRQSLAESGLELADINVQVGGNDNSSQQPGQEFAQERDGADGGLADSGSGAADATEGASAQQQLTLSPSGDDQGIEVDVIT